MPVPVPRIPKGPAHPVIKSHPGITNQVNSFQNLTRTLPLSPIGPPPSLGTREQWINSLPSWRREKPRRIWEDDSCHRETEQLHSQPGESVNSSSTHGTHVQARNALRFPLITPAVTCPTYSPTRGDADNEMSPDNPIVDQSHNDQAQWSPTSPANEDVDMEIRSQPHFPGDNPVVGGDLGHGPLFERGAFTPIFEEDSPRGREVASSPIEPVTPFGQFVDRAVAAAQADAPCNNSFPDPDLGQQYGYQDPPCSLSCCQVEYPIGPPPATEVPVTPAATAAYKKLAEPLADWVANYVWKVCTTGMSLPFAFSRPNTPARQYPIAPPSYLAASVHSLLLSTLLQPSAIFLAVWYIVRLPVYFDAVGLSSDHVKESLFRTELLGVSRSRSDRESMEASAPFRLILLGCMLANKWLDDHTFSNKTWHLISNVPIHSLNKLESVTLDIFSHDLSIPSHVWSQWLAHVISYHLSLTSQSHPQPISRPSTNPHTIVRMTIEELTQAPVACNTSHPSRSEPVFLGLEERRREKLEKEEAVADQCIDILEIDLDEDGPLREEYLPKRRVSAASVRGSMSATKVLSGQAEARTTNKLAAAEKTLPPPAKWSPAGDEPILRERSRVGGHYLAIRPPLNTSFPVAAHHQASQMGYQNWTSGGGGYISVNPPSLPFAHDYSQRHIEPTFNPYPFSLPVTLSHTRSHSLSHNQIDIQPCNHLRSHSQSQFEYWCPDMTAKEQSSINLPDAQWPVIDHQYGYSAHGYPFAPHLRIIAKHLA